MRGRNGAGKTSLLRVLAGLTLPESGQVEWAGEPIRSCRAKYGAEMAWCGHLTGLKPDLTVAQNLDFAGRLAGRSAESWAGLLETLGLASCRNLETRHLSAGQQRRAALARVLNSGARLWLIDEPFTNLDDAGRRLVQERIGQHARDGGIAVIAAHHEFEPAGVPVDQVTLGIRP